MPRLPQNLLLQAYKTSPFLPLLLRTTRDLPSAINELRWLREHVQASDPACPRQSRKRLLNLCKRRGRAEPLQYILGSQPFGKLDIKCRRGVLIPRPETEAYTTHLASLLLAGRLTPLISIPEIWDVPYSPAIKPPKRLRILDACSGSGCISLLLYTLLATGNWTTNVNITGIDISPTAIALANENIERNVKKGVLASPFPKIPRQPLRTYKFWSTKFLHEKNTSGHSSGVRFVEHDIFKPFPKGEGMYDIIISNPPYISSSAFWSSTSRSVRKWEPKLALVPFVPGDVQVAQEFREFVEKMKRGGRRQGEEMWSDVFYWQLLRLYYEGGWTRGPKVLVMEVGGPEQAIRVLKMGIWMGQSGVGRVKTRFAIWRDYPELNSKKRKVHSVTLEGVTVPVIGAGKMRAVVLFREKSLQTKQVVQEKKEKLPVCDGSEGSGTLLPKHQTQALEKTKSIWDIKREKRKMKKQGKKERKKERQEAQLKKEERTAVLAKMQEPQALEGEIQRRKKDDRKAEPVNEQGP